LGQRKIQAPMKSRLRHMSRLELVIGNWMLDKAKEQGFSEDHDPKDIYAEGIQLADQIRRWFKIEEKV
jgi:hypothetical protein